MSAGSGTENFLWAFAISQQDPIVYKLNPTDLTVIDSAQPFGNNYRFQQESGAKMSAAGPDGSLYALADKMDNGTTVIFRIYPDFTYQAITGIFTGQNSGHRPGLVTSDNFLWAKAASIQTIRRWPIGAKWSSVPTSTQLAGGGYSLNGSRHISYYEDYDLLIIGGSNTSGGGDQLISFTDASATDGSTAVGDTLTASDGGWIRGALIPKVDQGPAHAINSSALLYLNNQYNGDTYYRINVGSNGTLNGLNLQYTSNVYQYGGTQYLANVRALNGSTLEQGYGMGFSYYTNGNYNLTFNSDGIATQLWNYADFNAAVAPQNFQNGTINSCANPINQLFYTASHIGNGQGADIIAWEIDSTGNGVPRFVARTAQLWQNNGPYRAMGICHSTPDTHQQKFTPLPT